MSIRKMIPANKEYNKSYGIITLLLPFVYTYIMFLFFVLIITGPCAD